MGWGHNNNGKRQHSLGTINVLGTVLNALMDVHSSQPLMKFRQPRFMVEKTLIQRDFITRSSITGSTRAGTM